MKKKPVKDTAPKKQPVEKVVSAKARTIPKNSVYDHLEIHPGWITTGLILILLVIVFHKFLSGTAYYLFKDIGSDTINTVYPQLVLLSKYIRSEGFPLWSFAQGMGQNIMPTFGDPFNLIVIFGGPENAAYTIILMEIVKLALTSWVFYLFLGYWNLAPVARIAGTILYTFSGFMIVGGSWIVFTTEAFYFTFLLFAFEKFFSDRAWYFFPLAIALIAVIQPFNLYILGLFISIYFIFRYVLTDKPSVKGFLLLSVSFIGLSALGLLISSFFLVANVLMLLDSPRVGGSSSYFSKLMSFPLFGTEGVIHNGTAAFRFFGNDLLGNGSAFKGWYNYLEAPMTYIGLLPLLLFPQVFVMGTRREKITFGLLFLVFLLPVFFPFFRYTFWAFSGDYYRIFSLFVALIMLLFSLRFLSDTARKAKLNIPVFGATLFLLFVLLYYPYPNIEQVLSTGLRSYTVLMLLLYSAIILYVNYSKNRKPGFLLLLVVVVMEMAVTNYLTVNDRDAIRRSEWKQKAGYNDYTNDAVAFLKAREKGFFRVVKDYSSGPAVHTSFNDSKVQDFYGTLSYSSFNQKYYIRFQEELGIIKKGEEFQTRWAPGLAGKPLLQRIGSVKYLLTRQPAGNVMQFGFDSIGMTGDVRIMQNKNAMPLGFVYRSYISVGEFRKLPPQQREFMLFKAFVAEEPIESGLSGFKALSASDTTAAYSWEEFTADVTALKKDTLNIGHFSENRIAGKINLASAGLLFLSIPYDMGWHASIDGKETLPVLCNTGFIGLFVPAGDHIIEFWFLPRYFFESLWLSIGGIAVFLGMVVFWKMRKIRALKGRAIGSQQDETIA